MAVSKKGDQNLIPLQDIVVKIRVHKPFSSNLEDEEKLKFHRPKIQQEFLMLGSQPLTELRDRITCPNHFVKAGEYSEDPMSHLSQPFAKDLYKSGFFYIHQTFYNDMRDPDNIDYSEVIRKWAAENPDCTYGQLETALMEETLLRDVSAHMGCTYLYQHLGNCEHLVVIVNASLINRQNELCSQLYPMERSPFRLNPRLCNLCGFYSAGWVTIKNKRMPHDPSFFCDSCFFSYNYIDGKKIGSFSAYYYNETGPTTQSVKYSVKAMEKIDPGKILFQPPKKFMRTKLADKADQIPDLLEHNKSTSCDNDEDRVACPAKKFRVSTRSCLKPCDHDEESKNKPSTSYSLPTENDTPMSDEEIETLNSISTTDSINCPSKSTLAASKISSSSLSRKCVMFKFPVEDELALPKLPKFSDFVAMDDDDEIVDSNESEKDSSDSEKLSTSSESSSDDEIAFDSDDFDSNEADSDEIGSDEVGNGDIDSEDANVEK